MSKNISCLICPSIMAADCARLGEEAKRAEVAGADRLHVDIMDGHFVHNLTFGPSVVAAINRSTSLFLDVHLMMYNPYDYVEKFVESGADCITFHIEATEDVEETIDYIKRCHSRVGLSISPETPVELVMKYLPLLDQITIMGVHPGFAGQHFMPEVVDKIAEVRSALMQWPNLSLDIEVDGGIDQTTAVECASKGANVFVSGAFLFSALDMKKEIEMMRTHVQSAFCSNIEQPIKKKGHRHTHGQGSCSCECSCH